ncbi:OmpA family protein [Microbacterium sp. ZW T5_45]|uniref:OmpA family protein n=1 Tax=Microbacterium sp. ZW T5_45 TaxID=3378080 RepID=UPI00385387FB
MTTARITIPRSVIALSSIAVLALTGCAADVGAEPASSSSSRPAPSPTASAPSTPTVAGYDVGQFPPVPLFRLPDLALLDTSASAFTIEVNAALADIPGVTAAPAHCDESGAVVSGNGSAYLYGDGSGAFTGPDGTVQNFGDGSGTSTINGVTIQNFGDGSGNYSDGVVTIQNFGDGSGNYSDATTTVEIFGDGSGNYSDGEVTIQNFGDGSGNYTGHGVSIQNFGDGSGNYSDGEVTIQNFGDGTAKVDGVDVEAEPLATVPRLGSFPPLAALAPLESCGTTLTFEDGVLFDFDRSEIRADAATTLDSVASVLESLAVGDAVVSGHTDSIGDDAYNQQLSEARAKSVVEGLTERGATTRFTAEGFGETRPVAANEVDGADNPAGRQLNRRVEIFIPAAL